MIANKAFKCPFCTRSDPTANSKYLTTTFSKHLENEHGYPDDQNLHIFMNIDGYAGIRILFPPSIKCPIGGCSTPFHLFTQADMGSHLRKHRITSEFRQKLDRGDLFWWKVVESPKPNSSAFINEQKFQYAHRLLVEVDDTIDVDEDYIEELNRSSRLNEIDNIHEDALEGNGHDNADELVERLSQLDMAELTGQRQYNDQGTIGAPDTVVNDHDIQEIEANDVNVEQSGHAIDQNNHLVNNIYENVTFHQELGLWNVALLHLKEFPNAPTIFVCLACRLGIQSTNERQIKEHYNYNCAARKTLDRPNTPDNATGDIPAAATTFDVLEDESMQVDNEDSDRESVSSLQVIEYREPPPPTMSIVHEHNMRQAAKILKTFLEKHPDCTQKVTHYPTDQISQIHFFEEEPQDGFLCAQSNCSQTFTLNRRRRYKEHILQAHQDIMYTEEVDLAIIPCKLQSLYGSDNRTSFAVKPKEISILDLSIWERVVENAMTDTAIQGGISLQGAAHYNLVLKKFRYHSIFPEDTRSIPDFLAQRMGISSIIHYPRSSQLPSHQLICISIMTYCLRARQSLQDCEHIVRRHLGNKRRSQELENHDSREFRVISKESTCKYAAHLSKWVIYVLRVVAQPDIDEGLQLLPSQIQEAAALLQLSSDAVKSSRLSSTLQKVCRIPQEDKIHNNATIEADGWKEYVIPAVEALLPSLHSFLFLLVTLPHNDAVSVSLNHPLPRFLALSSWNPRGHTFKQPFEMGSDMAKVQYTMRCIILQEFNRLATNHTNPMILLQELHDKHLTQDQLHPFGTLISHLRYTSAVSSRMSLPPNAIWDAKSETLTFNGLQITFHKFCDMLRGITEECQNVLDNDVLFGRRREIFKQEEDEEFGRPNPIQDNPTERQEQYSYLSSPRFSKYHNSLFHIIQKYPNLQQAFFHPIVNEDQEPVMNVSGCMRWLASVDHFVEYLAVLIWFMGGQPPRGTEHVSTRIYNTAGAQRSIYSFQNQISIMLTYTKAENKTDCSLMVYRFLPTVIQRMFEIYLCCIRPFQEKIHNALHKSFGYRFDHVRPLLFTRRGQPMHPTTDFSRALCQITQRYTLHPWGLRAWRQIMILLSLSKMPDHIKQVTTSASTLTVQASHRRQAADQNYGRLMEGSNLSASNAEFEAFRTVSLAWHSLIGFPHPTLPCPLRGNHLTTTLPSAIHTTQQGYSGNIDNLAIDLAERITHRQTDLLRQVIDQRIDAVISRHTAEQMEVDPTPVQMIPLRNFVSFRTKKLFRDVFSGREDVEFRTPEQGQAVEYTLQRQSTPLLAIFPMGYGKTAIYLTAVKFESDQKFDLITIVIVPLVSLASAATLSAKNLGINVFQLTPDFSQGDKIKSIDASLVIMTFDLFVASSSIGTWVRSLASSKRLARIVVDEAHTLITEQHYRENFKGVYRCITTTAVPLLFMTGTLPAYEMEKFRQICDAHHSIYYLRLPTVHRNLSYSISSIQATYNNFAKFCNQVKETILPHLQMHLQDRALIFVRTRAEATKISTELSCRSYHSQSMSADKQEVLKTWLDVRSNDVSSHLIVATSSLALGVDYSHVRYVWFFGDPYTAITFAQMATRGGRDGELAHIRLYPTPATTLREEERELEPFRNAVHCRRDALSLILNNAPMSCASIANAAPCDLCQSDNAQVTHLPREIPSNMAKMRMEIRSYTLVAMVKELYCVVRALEHCCPYCALGNKDANHHADKCPSGLSKFRSTLQQRLKTARRKKHIEGLAVCIFCNLPQSSQISGAMQEHMEYVQLSGQPCRLYNLCTDIILAILSNETHAELIQRHLPPNRHHEVIEWMLEPLTTGPVGSTQQHHQALNVHLLLLSVASQYQYVPPSVTRLVQQAWFQPWCYVTGHLNGVSFLDIVFPNIVSIPSNSRTNTEDMTRNPDNSPLDPADTLLRQCIYDVISFFDVHCPYCWYSGVDDEHKSADCTLPLREHRESMKEALSRVAKRKRTEFNQAECLQCHLPYRTDTSTHGSTCEHSQTLVDILIAIFSCVRLQPYLMKRFVKPKFPEVFNLLFLTAHSQPFTHLHLLILFSSAMLSVPLESVQLLAKQQPFQSFIDPVADDPNSVAEDTMMRIMSKSLPALRKAPLPATRNVPSGAPDERRPDGPSAQRSFLNPSVILGSKKQATMQMDID